MIVAIIDGFVLHLTHLGHGELFIFITTIIHGLGSMEVVVFISTQWRFMGPDLRDFQYAVVHPAVFKRRVCNPVDTRN